MFIFSQKEFSGGDEGSVQLVVYDTEEGCFDPEHSAALAWAKLREGEKEGAKESIWLNSSEQFVVWCKTGLQHGGRTGASHKL